MCNRRHQWDSTPIPKSGIGWKLFEKGDDGKVRTLFHGQRKYTKGQEGWTKWSKFIDDGDGFCFFPTRQIARDCQKELRERSVWRKMVLKKIEYDDGIEEHIEDFLTYKRVKYRTRLAKKFRIIE